MVKDTGCRQTAHPQASTRAHPELGGTYQGGYLWEPERQLMTTSNSLYSHRKQNSFIATCLKDSKFRNAAFLTYLIKGHYKIPRQLNHQETTESCSKERKARAIKTNQMLLSNHNPNLTPNYSNYTKTRAGFPA